jgi:hypothetical protein
MSALLPGELITPIPPGHTVHEVTKPSQPPIGMGRQVKEQTDKQIGEWMANKRFDKPRANDKMATRGPSSVSSGGKHRPGRIGGAGLGWVKSGYVMLGVGQVRSGQVMSGHVMSGQVRLG